MNALTLKEGASCHSAYDPKNPLGDQQETHTLAVRVDNEAGVLALFSGRGYNIDSLTVAETDHAGHLSRITIVATGTPAVIEQIKAQLGRPVPVHEVEKHENCFPMIPSGKAHNEMLMAEDATAEVVDAAGAVLV